MISVKTVDRPTDIKVKQHTNINVKVSGVTVKKEDVYTGDYTVIPSVEKQILNTSNKIMKDDVTVLEIPFFETSNDFGGTTCYIGKECEIYGL